MATPAQRTNTWTLDEWYDQAVAGTEGSYMGFDQQLWTWGRGNQGQLDNSIAADRSSPIQVGSNAGFIGANSAPRSSYGIKADNTLWTWGGNNNYGTLGLNSETQYSSPVQVPGSWASAIGSGGENAAIGVKTSGCLLYTSPSPRDRG